jgi:hypothetical protein
MTVSITISETSGGDALAGTTSSGTVSAGSASTAQDLYIRHNASVNPITDCALYLVRMVGSGYLGSDADSDFTEIMDTWGPAGGGFQYNTDQPSFAVGNWTSFKTGHGDSDNPVTLPTAAVNIGTPAQIGDIPVSGEAHIQVRWSIPASVPAGAGYRAVSLVFAYSATS